MLQDLKLGQTLSNDTVFVSVLEECELRTTDSGAPYSVVLDHLLVSLSKEGVFKVARPTLEFVDSTDGFSYYLAYYQESYGSIQQILEKNKSYKYYKGLL
jgi:hypothetical protein